VKRTTALTIALSIITASILLSCAAPEAAVYSDPTSTIFTTVNSEFTIAIPANPTTGYQWAEEHNASMLSLVSSEYKPSKQAKNVVGAGGTQYFKFKALKAGTAIISFTYKRAGDPIVADQTAFNVVIEQAK